MSGIRILGCGHSTSGHKVTNEDLSKFVDTTDEWIRTRTGIRARSVSMNKNTSELALEASKLALHQADIEKDKISLVIVATATADQITPSCSCMVAQ
jgi:3-oxoacyl-[acyl-carrier-protein] synthase-3